MAMLLSTPPQPPRREALLAASDFAPLTAACPSLMLELCELIFQYCTLMEYPGEALDR